MKRFYLSFFILLTLAFSAQAQFETPGVTVGLLYADQSQVAPGYLLYSPSSSNKAFLIDNCGYVVNEWTFDGSSNFSGTYLLEDGSIAKLNLQGGGGSAAAYGDACFEHRDWDNNLLWYYCGEGRYEGIHSDLYHLPNGNFLALVQDPHSASEAIQMGVNPNNVGNSFNTESVVEFMPIGTDDAEVVWEWHLWDHLVQDFDATKPNYGVISDFPHRYDANIMGSNAHYNSLNYLPDRDHVMMSSWKDDEIYIIDHSINSYDAAGPAGDFLFRWGRPGNYDTDGEQLLFGQHNPKIIPDEYYLHGSKISVFNNGYSGAPGSGACIINPVYDVATNTYAKNASGAFLPEDFDYAWAGEIFPGSTMSSGIMGGVDVQVNGNIVICEATKGRLSEVTPAGEVVWVYQNPVQGGSTADQGESSNGDIYKVVKYAPSYVGLTGSTDPIATVENENILSEVCNGNANTALNVSLANVLNVNSFGCSDAIEPILQVYNVGSEEITEMVIEYSVNVGATQSYTWTGSIDFGSIEQIQMPPITYTNSPLNELELNIISVNGSADEVPSNNEFDVTWVANLPVETGLFSYELLTDNWGYETRWEILNEAGTVVHEGDNFDNNELYEGVLAIEEGGCYTIYIIDSFGDGILGGGYFRLFDPTGILILEAEGDFDFGLDETFNAIEPLAAPTAGFDYETNGDEVIITNTSEGVIDNVLWTFGNGMYSNEFDPATFTFTEPGTYNVCLVVANAAGLDTLCQDIVVEFVGIENIFIEGAQVEVFPNPVTQSYFNIRADGIFREDVTVRIFDLYGRLMQRPLNLNSGLLTIETSHWSSGTYIIEFKSSNKTLSQKLQVMN